MNKALWVGGALAAAAYWASRQPGGIQGTCERMQQSVRDIAAGQDPAAVCKRFMSGGTEEPAGAYTAEPDVQTSVGNYLPPYRDHMTTT